VKRLRESAGGVAVAMEPSGVYGDALRWQLLTDDFTVHRVSPKKSNDSREIYDGVPSSHDAKSAAIVAWLHFHGKSEPWPVKSVHERSLKAALWLLEVHAKQLRQNRNRLEALTARHWPELTRILDLDTATALELLATYGGPVAVGEQSTQAAELMRRVGGSMLLSEKVDAVVASAATTTGLPQVAEEVALVRGLAAEARRNQREERSARRRVEELAMAEEGPAKEMQAVVGKTTAAVVVAAAGDPTAYESPQALVKSLGLNLKERSSGEKQNRGLHITKRGSGAARMYLYMASLRLIQRDPVVRAWYQKKVKRDGGRGKIKAVVAVSRKLTLALWHVARGERFDATKLFDTRKLAVNP
jgi:transposase